MGLLEWYNNKKEAKLNSLKKSREDYDRSWQGFLEVDTYLCYKDKAKFQRYLNKGNKLGVSSWYLWFSKQVRDGLREYNVDFEKWNNQLSKYNPTFIRSRLKKHEKFFDGKDDGLTFPLDEDQRRSVVVDEKHNLVIAGAGSGKTAVLTSKVAYLVRRNDNIDPSKILVLAFNKDAVSEIKERLDRDYKIKGVNIMNFHQLGRKILMDVTKKSPKLFGGGDAKKYQQKINEIIEELLEDKNFQDLFLKYVSDYLEEEEVAFDEKEEYFEYMRNKKYKTLNSLTVKSISERTIANFLFQHNIKFEYEPTVDWVDKDKDATYNPDFYLPDYDIYIEHWGLNKKGEVPEWFTTSSEDYNRIKDWKLEQFKKHNKVLVETWDYERGEGSLIDNLKERLNNINNVIKFEKLSYKDIVNKTFAFRENKGEITDMISAFVTLCKTNSITSKEIRSRVRSKDYTDRQKHFAKIAVEVFLKYQEFLKKSDQIDFNDMILNAVKAIIGSPQKISNIYDYILVDEFQDISKPRLELIKALLSLNKKCKLFCVGDDWQSINGFAGSEVDYFVGFEDEFSRPEKLVLKTNYRSSKTIVDMSSELISHNDNQVKKEVIHYDGARLNNVKAHLITSPTNFMDNEDLRMENYLTFIKRLIARGVHPTDILVLGRFNRMLYKLKLACERNGVNVHDPGERKKGIRIRTVHKSKGLEAKHVLILDVVSGTYGFPSEMKDSSVLEVAKKSKKREPFEEERRLFYVALTRAKEYLYIFTVDKNKSVFLSEVEDFT